MSDPSPSEGCGDDDTEAGVVSPIHEMLADRKYAAVVVDLVGHPVGAPTLRELDYMNPGLDTDTILRCLDALDEAGVVELVEISPEEPIPEDVLADKPPFTAYRLTAAAWEVVEEDSTIPLPAWRRVYAAVEKPADITAFESISRPDGPEPSIGFHPDS